jgi:uncharacterized protein YciI
MDQNIENQFNRYVILLTSSPAAKRDENTIRDHVAFLRKLEGEGKLVLCGPFTDHAGGMIVIKAKDKAEATAIAKSDPFVRSGSRSFEVRSWLLSCEENNHLGMG